MEIPFDETANKDVLVNLVREYKANLPYVFEEIGRRHGITIRCLPPYHPELNPIEGVWSWLKHKVKKGNTRCKTKGLRDAVAEQVEASAGEAAPEPAEPEGSAEPPVPEAPPEPNVAPDQGVAVQAAKAASSAQRAHTCRWPHGTKA